MGGRSEGTMLMSPWTAELDGEKKGVISKKTEG